MGVPRKGSVGKPDVGEVTEVVVRKRLCGAKRKGGQAPCQGVAMPNGRCRFHGGATPEGMSSPNFKHGRRSKLIGRMPIRYRQAFADALEDSESLSTLDNQIAMADVRESELMSQLSPEGGTANWKKALEALEDITVHREKSIETLRSVIEAGVSEGAVWAEIMAVWESRRKLVDTERRRKEGERVYMTGEQAMFLAVNFFRLVRDSGADRKAMRFILEGLQKLMPHGERAEVQGALAATRGPDSAIVITPPPVDEALPVGVSPEEDAFTLDESAFSSEGEAGDVSRETFIEVSPFEDGDEGDEA